ncbi:MAG: hypothetical protein HY869_21475 [Chloroflexi bacterium]|nr:hypothetical protein [Chloroflexota bacterium]
MNRKAFFRISFLTVTLMGLLFLFVQPGLAAIGQPRPLMSLGWVGNMWPAGGTTHTITTGTSFNVYVQVWKGGVTDSSGQGANITCTLTWTPVPYFGGSGGTTTETAMTYNGDPTPSNDEYMATITPSVGLYEISAYCTDTTDSTSMEQGAGKIKLVVDAASGACNGAVQNNNNLYWNGLFHDSFSTSYRTPTGPVTTGSTVTLTFRTCMDDVNAVPTIRIWNDRTNTSTTPAMTFDGHGSDATLGGVTYWTYDLSVGADPTIYYYVFQTTDGSATAYYRDDDPKFYGGGYGAAESNQTTAYDNSYQLTVYDPSFSVPSWMQRGVVYQIFPDRFRDGSAGNNPAAGRFFYNESGGTIVRSNDTDWNTAICDPRSAGGCLGDYSNNFYGGDLAGITAKINAGYFDQLGVSVIYLNPIFLSPSNHKYDTANYLQIDPDFGTLTDFGNLVTAANSHNIKIILDGVFNHTSSDSMYFDRYGRYDSAGTINDIDGGTDDNTGACEAGASPFYSWFYFPAGSNPGKDQPGNVTVYCPNGAGNADQTYEAWYGYSSLPKLQANIPAVTDLIWDNGTSSVGPYWIDQGASGWRFDVGADVDPGLTNDPSNDYWEGFRTAVRTVDSETITLGEEWGDASPWLLGNEWDSVMNYRYRSAVMSWLFTGCSGDGCTGGTSFSDNDSNSFSSSGSISAITPSQFNARLLSIQEDYPPMAWKAMMNLEGSHDTNRIRFLLKKVNNNDDPAAIQRMKELWLFAFTYAGAPTLYYGDEVGLSQDGVWDGSQYQDDPYNRAPFPWDDESGTSFTADTDLQDFARQMASIRHSYRALQDGDVQHGILIDDVNKLYGFARTNGSQTALIVLNRDSSSHSVTLSGLNSAPYSLTNGTDLVDVISGDTYTVSGGAVTGILVDATWGAVLLEQNKIETPAEPGAATFNFNGSDVTLGWNLVSLDSGIGRETPTVYTIHRSATYPFTPDGSNWLANVNPPTYGAAQSRLTYTDSGVSGTAAYAICAENAGGKAGCVTFAPQCAADTNMFRSTASGLWTDETTWQVSPDGISWAAASCWPTADNDAIDILAGHTVTVDSNFPVDQLTIASTAQVTVDSGTTWTVANGTGTDLTVNGTVANAGTITMTGSGSFAAGSTYQHSQNGGVIPTETWNSTSTVLVTGVTTTAPTGLGQTFGNFTWNSTGQTADVTLAGGLTTVVGNFTVTSTGASQLGLVADSPAAPTTNITGNLTVNGGTFAFSTGTSAPTVNLTGNVVLAGGTLRPGAGSGVPTFTVRGNWTNNGSAFDGGTGTVTFNGTAGQTINGTAASQTFNHITISKTAGTLLNTGGSTTSLTVNNLTETTGNFTAPAALDINGNFVHSAGTFTAGANITIAGNWTNNAAGFGANGGTVTFDGATQALGGSTATTFSTLTVANGSTTTSTINPTIATFNVNNGGKYIHNPTVAAGLPGTTRNFGATSTIEYQRNSAAACPVSANYGNLIINVSNFSQSIGCAGALTSIAGDLEIKNTSGFEFRFASTQSTTHNIGGNLIISGGTLVFSSTTGAPTVNVAGNTTISSGTLNLGGGSGAPTLNISGNFTQTGGTLTRTGTNNRTINLAGNWSYSAGTFTNTGIVVNMNGTLAQTIGGSAATTFNSLTISNTAGVSLSGVDATVNSVLTLGANKLATGANRVILVSTSSLSRTTGWVNGNLQKPVAANTISPITFEVGGATNYAPITITFSGVSAGTLTGSTTDGQHPAFRDNSISSENYINRYWTLTPSVGMTFTSYDATFTFNDPGDYVGSPTIGSLALQKYSGGIWTSSPNTPSSTATTVTGTGFTSFSDFYAGNGGTPLPVTLSYVNAARNGTEVLFDWSTVTESGNLGFNLYGVDENGQRVLLNKALIPSQDIDSLSRLDYSLQVETPFDTFYIEEVDITGRGDWHGPYQVGQTYGARAESSRIDWAAVRAERQAASKDLRLELTALPEELKLNLKVRQTGLQRVTYEMLRAAGLDLEGLPAANLLLTNRGKQVPLYVGGPDPLGAGSFLEFNGEALDTLYTDANVYTLQVSPTPVGSLLVEDTNFNRWPMEVALSYTQTLVLNNQREFANYAPGADAWYDTSMTAYTSARSWEIPFQVDGLADPTEKIDLDLVVWGVTDWPQSPDHHLLVSVNGLQVATDTFDGLVERTLHIALPAGLLREGSNTLTLTLPGDTGVPGEVINLDKFSLTYSRLMQAREGRLAFTAAANSFTVTNLPGEDVVVYRVNSKGTLTRMDLVRTRAAGDGSFTATFNGAPQPTKYIVSTVDAMFTPEFETPYVQADLDQPAQYLVIAHPDFIAGIQPLVQAREAQGLTVSVVDVTDLYRRYTYGIFDPQAIQQYIAYAVENLGTEYVLLVGGDTYDYRNHLGIDSVSFIPSLYVATGPIARYVPADPLYADVNHDNVPDVALGRFPVRSAAELNLMVSKTLAYASKAYDQTAVFASDLSEGGLSFKDINEAMSAQLPGWSVENVHLDDLSVVTARNQLIAAMNRGTALVTFTGHSGPQEWTFSSLFDMSHAAALTNHGKPFVVVQWGCWNSYYIDPQHNYMVQSFLFSGDQGAAAVLGASTLTDSTSEILLGRLLTPKLASPGVTLGQALLLAKNELAQAHPELLDVLLGWSLMGDPALVITP